VLRLGQQQAGNGSKTWMTSTVPAFSAAMFSAIIRRSRA